MVGDDDLAEHEPVTYRTQADANALIPKAREVLDEVIRRLPKGSVMVHLETLFVGRSVPEEVACVAATIPGVMRKLTALEFRLDYPFDENVDRIVAGLLRYRERVLAEVADDS